MAVCKKCGKNLKSSNIVLTVSPGSEAEKKGIVKGDKIVAIDGKTVKNKEEIISAINDIESCKINVSHKEQINTIQIESISSFMNGIDFKDEETCSNCGAKQKNNIIPLIIGIVAALIIIGIMAIVAIPKKSKLTTTSIEIEDNIVAFGTDTVGSDTMEIFQNSSLTVDFNGKDVQITSSGTLSEVEKSNNIEYINQQLEKTNTDTYDFLNFEDSAPVFSYEKVGSDTYRKMYSKNENFDVRKPIINGYVFNDLTQDRLADIGQKHKEILGTVYFDYGYANAPKNAIVQTKTVTLGQVDFNQIRYTETIVALKSILSEIPQAAINTTIIYLDGHTDHTSPHDFNQTLSEARAECIKEILIRNFGINEKNIVTKGYSWDRLAVNTLDECAENRRVEISVAFFN